MTIETKVVGPYAENAYVAGFPDTGDGFLVDPGDEAERIAGVIERLGLKIRYILNTHAHVDHVLAVDAMKELTGAPFYIHQAEEQVLEGVSGKAVWMEGSFTAPVVDGHMRGGDTFEVGGVTIGVLDTPGHSPGGVSLLVDNVVFTGDALYAGSIGRVDLPGGSMEVLLESIRSRLFTLPDETVVYPGHGPATTITHEKAHNPFFQILRS